MTPDPNSAPLDKPVFYLAAALLVITVGTAALMPEQADRVFSGLQSGIIVNGSWYYVLVVAIILVVTIGVALTRYGEIKLGLDHAEAEYSLISWFAMLFAAGMGIGLMFFGVAEPVMHFLVPPHGDGGTVAAAREAMKLTFFHWGFHAWATYAIVALILGYFGYRHGLPLTLKSALYPLIGERAHGPIGTAVDVFAILSTTFGVATSLGFGVEQINSGLNYLFDVPRSSTVQVVLILVTTLLATVSVVMGLDAGIKRLSEINIALAVLLLIGVLLLGPTVYLLQAFMQNTGSYLADIVSKTFNLYAYEPTDWIGGWTIFYWGWWISWAPFVGLFIARISRGRTLREFVLGALAAPTLFTLLWMTVFGNSGISLILDQGDAAFAAAVQLDESVALFQFFEQFPLSGVLSGIAIVMVMVFFVTSADSGAMVLNMLSSHGRDDTPMLRRVFWMGMVGAVATVLMLAGGLSALQTAAIAGALPFSLVLLVAIWGFLRALSVDHAKRLTQVPSVAVPAGHVEGEQWRARLANLLDYPTQASVQQFLQAVVEPALRRFAAELEVHGLTTRAFIDEQGASLDVLHGEEIDFTYRVACREHVAPDGAAYFRAEVHLNEGGQDYDVMGWNTDQLLHDVLQQYERHLHFLHVLR